MRVIWYDLGAYKMARKFNRTKPVELASRSSGAILNSDIESIPSQFFCSTIAYEAPSVQMCSIT